jgi:hypothetical protein
MEIARLGAGTAAAAAAGMGKFGPIALLTGLAALVGPILWPSGPRPCDAECRMLRLERRFFVRELDAAIEHGDLATAKGWRAAIQDLDRGAWRISPQATRCSPGP